MTTMGDYIVTSTDSSLLVSARYGETAGAAIAVDTGLGVSIGVEVNPFFQIISPDLDSILPFLRKDAIPVQANSVAPFAESEICKLMHLDSETNPVLADIWRDNPDDEFTSS